METTLPNATATPDKVSKDIYQQVTDIIIQQLETGVIPWQKPWAGDNGRLLKLPKNCTTGNYYNEINIVLLWSSVLKHNFATDDWASFKQWRSKDEIVRTGEKGNLIVYYDTFKKEVDGEIKLIPFLKTSYVFNRCQLTGYEAPPEIIVDTKPDNNAELIVPVEDFVANTKAIIKHGGDRACYKSNTDKITIPPVKDFKPTESGTAIENYYAVLLHELTHWTGHEKRLDRFNSKKFGDQGYASEELVAEFGAAFLCAGFGLATAEKGNHAGYIDHWLKVLKENNRYIFTAASEASKAVDYLENLQPK